MMGIVGGVGDILLSLEDALKEPEICVITHAEHAGSIFAPFPCTKAKILKLGVDPLPPGMAFIKRTSYPRIDIPEPYKSLSLVVKHTSSKPIIGIHPFKSKHAKEFWLRRGVSEADISIDSINRACLEYQDRCTFVVFCSPDEEPSLRALRIPSVVIANPDLWIGLSLVSSCSLFIGADSAMKTMSCLLRIPSLVFTMNVVDPAPDLVDLFIGQYARDGVLTSCPLINDDVTSQVIKDFLSNKLNGSSSLLCS